MFRKIHSKRDPRDTLLVALQREFAGQFEKFNARFLRFTGCYPRLIFGVMVLLLSLSVVCSLLFARHEPRVPDVIDTPAVQSSLGGLGQMMQKAEAIRESLRISKEVNALLAQDSLSRADSLRLARAIDRFHELTITTCSDEIR